MLNVVLSTVSSVMTEIKKMILTPTVQKFVLHWGEMGTRWGVNRTVAQIHALLYLSPSPLCADDLVDALKVARSNVSHSVRELEMQGLAQRSHILGDRRDHYTTHTDIWELFKVIAEERKKREIDPTLEMLRQCVEELDADEETRGVTKLRIRQMQEFLEQFSNWYTDIARLPPPVLRRLVGMGAKIAKLIPGHRAEKSA